MNVSYDVKHAWGRMRWVGHVARVEAKRNAYRILVYAHRITGDGFNVG
jgi:hypothetical protein